MGESAAGRPEAVGAAREGSTSDERLLTVEDLARRTGLSVEEARGRIVAGDPSPRVVEVDGRLEVRVAAEDAAACGVDRAGGAGPARSRDAGCLGSSCRGRGRAAGKRPVRVQTVGRGAPENGPGGRARRDAPARRGAG
ncbi:MAG: hypothetical protein ACYCX9_02105 [Candidatus Dormibacteria bacterium]